VSLFGKVYDLTRLVGDGGAPPSLALLKNAGKDVSHWFDPTTGDVRTHVHPESNLAAPYTPEGSVPHVGPHAPRTDWAADFAAPWWRDEAAYCIGRLTAHTRQVEVLNTLTG
jgi:hypothetical protein